MTVFACSWVFPDNALPHGAGQPLHATRSSRRNFGDVSLARIIGPRIRADSGSRDLLAFWQPMAVFWRRASVDSSTPISLRIAASSGSHRHSVDYGNLDVWVACFFWAVASWTIITTGISLVTSAGEELTCLLIDHKEFG